MWGEMPSSGDMNALFGALESLGLVSIRVVIGDRRENMDPRDTTGDRVRLPSVRDVVGERVDPNAR